MKLAHKVALVTGSATGIGRAIALALAGEGADIVVNYTRSKTDAVSTASRIRSLGRRTLVVQTDVSQSAQVRAMVEATVAEFGRIDILVNNAGATVYLPFAELEKVTEADWDRIFAVNAKGAFLCAQAVAPIMRRQGAGSIINIASTAGLRASGSSIPYCCSKASVVMLTACLAKALAPQVRVNAVAPGLIQTRWHDNLPPEAWAGRTESTPLKRIGQPEDVAQAVLFLATSGEFVTGQTVVVDGGWGL